MNAASFELRCWAHTGTKHSETQKVLGLKWDTETDELYCVSPETDMGISDNISKRKLLSIANSIYDPIGFTSPATLLPKLLLQEAWRNKLDWDEEFTLDMQLRYRRWAKHIALIEKCRIPRRILHGNFKKAILHIFTDASAHGYACWSFLRCEDEGEVKVSLISAKARVAPVQRPTIPRLELLGVAIGARIASTILEALDLPLKTYFWTDSMIVLGWITNTEPWNTFVGNRVKEIRELTKVEDWRFVPGDVNPADLPSRSCNWFELLQSKWWEGPKWLYEPPEFWPYTEITLPEEAMKERRKSVVVNLNIDTKEHFGNRLLYFSSYPRIIRMIAWILRFCQNIRSEWLTDIQEKYAQTIQFYEENKILKVKSRLILEEDPEDFVRPTVLPDQPIVRRLINYVHQKLQHAGVQTTLSHLHERFWIPRGRRIAREVLQKCVTCKRYTLRPMVPDGPAPLPTNRINRVAAFEVTGTDLAEGIFIRAYSSPQSFSKRRNLSPGDIVLVGSDNTKRLNWPLGRIIELFKGKDNVERVARLRVAKEEIIRPIQRIYPLKLSSSDILNDVPVRVKDSSCTSDNDNQHTVSNEQSFEPEDLPKEQLETLKRSRFGRQIVPVKRLDL
ncbi:reverse transcriptase [Caerostris extrusa]|uniref:Reverse transcriptase n=1 Tax=Caerostris extrusa TaxID=172846 RepID=A0AAV4U4M0_CAEEX|nr:reverse transcriptase [Caerostris extrusa]